MIYEQERRLSETVKRDEWYQELLRRCAELEPEYVRIRDGLPKADREKLEEYISICEEMGHRKAQLALRQGRI